MTGRRLAVCVALLLLGCPPRHDYTLFYAHQPRSIVVVPVLNDSPEVNAPAVFITTVSVPLAERGYYVFPVYLTDVLLRDLGLPEAGLVHQLPANRFYDYFGADAVMFVTIKDWSTKYLFIWSSVEVAAEYVLKDTRTGAVLWQRTQKVAQSSGGSNLIEMAVEAAVNALMTDYRPLAQQANSMVFTTKGSGLPTGPHHPEYGKDHDRF